MCFFKIRKKANNKYNMLLRSEKNSYLLLQNRGVLPLRTYFGIALFFNFFRVHWEQRERLHTYVTSRITYFLQGGLFL